MDLFDTIAAISTPYGKGGIAVIRISGREAICVADRVFFPRSGKPLSDIPSARAVYGDIFERRPDREVYGDATARPDRELYGDTAARTDREACGDTPTRPRRADQIDDGIATVFRAPASFTGEDTVEISCHGGILVTQKVLSAILTSGARAAEPGEFTRRAFINGKLSLTEAEALGDLLEAQTGEQISLARSGMRGALTDASRKIYDPLCEVLAAIFAKIDYPDEDLADIGHDEMLTVAKDARDALLALARTYSTGHAIAEGVPTAIVGRTNAGKSSLYNRILGREAAIVTDIEGTTRDVLTERVAVGRVTLRLSDTAGLRLSDDAVEKIGIERAKKEAESAELILAVFDGSRAPDGYDGELCEYLSALPAAKIAVINKSDLGKTDAYRALGEGFDRCVHLSAESGDGFDSLVDAVEELYIDRSLDTSSDAIVSNARQNAALISAAEALGRAIEAMEGELPLEICCAETEAALGALGELDGRTVSEEIVSRIFSHFCVGK